MKIKMLTLLMAAGMACTAAYAETPATYHVETEKLHIPRIDMFFGGQRVGIVAAEMQLMPENAALDFTVQEVMPLDAELSKLSMNEKTARRFREEVYSGGDLSVIKEIFAPNVTITSLDSQRPDFGQGIQAVEKIVAMYREAFPDLQFDIEDIYSAGTKVTLRWMGKGRHSGDLPNLSATGIKGNLKGIDIFRFKAGKITQWWVSVDSFGLFEQLGALSKQPPKPSVVAKNKEVARLFLDDLLSQGDLSVAEKIFAPNAMFHLLDSFTPDFGTGPEAIKQIATLYRNTFNDLQIDIEEVTASGEGDTVVARFTINGTQTGDLPGIPANEIQVSIKGIDIYHIMDGQIVGMWHTADTLGLMKQLDAVPEQPAEPSVIAQNKQIVRLFLGDLLSEGKMSVADEIMAPDALIHPIDSFTPNLGTGPEGMKNIVALYHSAFPDMEITIDEIATAGDKVTARFTINGTHEGDLPGLPATGKTISIQGLDLYHIKAGKIVEFWHDADTLGLMKQLGAVAEGATIAENTAVVRLFLTDLLSEGKMSVADEIMAAEAVIHPLDSFTPDLGTGPEGMKNIVALYHSAFPDLNITVEDITTAGDKVTARFTINGTHEGDLPGIPATGKKVSVPGIDFYHIQGGKIVEFWHYADTLGMIQKLSSDLE
jgi:steroid delta-isomerase-like uncharacterized protein